jgi:hypothetical protein
MKLKKSKLKFLGTLGAIRHNELDQIDKCAVTNCTKLREPKY